jgi:anti-sigma factor ChrR (cupin superfamily)
MTATPLSQIISLSDLAWQERQPGVRAKSIWEHPESKRRAVLTRIEPEAKLPLHRHVGDELIFVIEGALSDDFGTVTAERLRAQDLDAARRHGPRHRHRRRRARQRAGQCAALAGRRGE